MTESETKHPKLYLVTGGSGSGKSEYAEQLAMDCGGKNRIYLATMRIWDEEGKRRVARHREMRRAKGFITEERFTDLEYFSIGSGLDCPESSTGRGRQKADVILLECLSNLTANEFDRQEDGALGRILRGIDHLQGQCRTLIIVTNEIFSDGISYDPETERYLTLFGACSRRLGEKADSVIEVVYGIPLIIK